MRVAYLCVFSAYLLITSLYYCVRKLPVWHLPHLKRSRHGVVLTISKVSNTMTSTSSSATTPSDTRSLKCNWVSREESLRYAQFLRSNGFEMSPSSQRSFMFDLPAEHSSCRFNINVTTPPKLVNRKCRAENTPEKLCHIKTPICPFEFVIRERIFSYDRMVKTKTQLGGSDFRVEISSGSSDVNVCNVRDDANGIYGVSCPMLGTDAKPIFCANVDVVLMFVDFMQFRGAKNELLFNPLCQPLFRVRICWPNNARLFSPGANFSAWILDNKYLTTWIDRGVKLTPRYNFSECLLRLGHPIFFVGASHIRYIYDVYALQLGDLPKTLAQHHGDYSCQKHNIHFLITLYTFHEVTQKLETIKQMLSLAGKSKATVVISSGAWDLTVFGLRHHLSVGVPDLIDGLLALQRSLPHVRILQFLNVAYPPEERFPARRGGRSIAAMAVANHRLRSELTRIGVEVIDPLSLLSAHARKFVFHNHYVGRTVGNVIHGPMRSHVMELVTQKICLN